MRFLVTIDGSNVGVGMPPQELARVMEQMVIPGVEKKPLISHSALLERARAMGQRAQERVR